MHELAGIRRDLGRVNDPPDGPAPRAHRADPLPGLRAEWSETLGLDVILAASATEYQASRIMHGAVRVREIQIHGSQAVTTQMHCFLGFATDVAALDNQRNRHQAWTIDTINDLTQRHGGIFPVSSFPFRVEPMTVLRLGTWRVIFGGSNPTANGTRLSGFVVLDHLVPTQ